MEFVRLDNLLLQDNGDGSFDIYDPEDKVFDLESGHALNSSQVLERDARFAAPVLISRKNSYGQEPMGLALGYTNAPWRASTQTTSQVSFRRLGGLAGIALGLAWIWHGTKPETDIDETDVDPNVELTFTIYASASTEEDWELDEEPEDEAEKLFEEASEHLNQGRREEARELLLQSGKLFRERGDVDRAENVEMILARMDKHGESDRLQRLRHKVIISDRSDQEKLTELLAIYQAFWVLEDREQAGITELIIRRFDRRESFNDDMAAEMKAVLGELEYRRMQKYRERLEEVLRELIWKHDIRPQLAIVTGYSNHEQGEETSLRYIETHLPVADEDPQREVLEELLARLAEEDIYIREIYVYKSYVDETDVPVLRQDQP